MGCIKYIWIKIIKMGNMHKSCHFLSLFMVTGNQIEPSVSPPQKYPVDKYTNESHGVAFILLQVGSI